MPGSHTATTPFACSTYGVGGDEGEDEDEGEGEDEDEGEGEDESDGNCEGEHEGELKLSP